MRPFAIERHFARFEHSVPHLLCSSDCEPLTLAGLLAIADPESRERFERLSLGYTESAGCPELRAEIAALYRGVDPDQVLEVVPEEGIYLAMLAMLRPGDRVVVTWPGYQSLHSIAEDMGCEVVRWQPDEASGWRFSVDELRSLVTPGTRLVVVNLPHNPTGATLTPDEFREVAGIAGEAGAHLFSDEMYRWLEADEAQRLPSACECGAHTVTLGGMSKAFSLPGLRVGWLVTRDADLLRRIGELKDFTTICASAPSEVLALMGLRARAGIVAANRATIAGGIAAVEAFVAHSGGGASWHPPRAGSVGLVRLEAPEGVSAVAERAAGEAGVMVLPSAVFEYGDRHMRVGLGRAAFPEALEVFEAWYAQRSETTGGRL